MVALHPDYIRSLHILALESVENGYYEAWYRSVCRWYSREFSTPLQDVMEKADEEILSTYFEDNLWRVKNSDSDKAEDLYEEIREKIVTSPEEWEEIEQEDDDWADDMIREIKEGEEKEEKVPAFTKEQNSEGMLEIVDDLKRESDPNLKGGEQYTISGEGIDFIPEDGLE